jgi:glycine/D-amino acid oxidase-like deaminating enzyme/nitrite reductase/ring-hydroxylating ferredoxin subunit
MGNLSGNSTSPWMKSLEELSFPKLSSNAQVDVCVIGAGIAGITTAYLLGRKGLKVLVLDHACVGGGQTGRTTAHLTNVLDDRYFKLIKLHGKKKTRLAAESHTTAIDKIETLVRTEGIACDFERLDGYLFVPPGDSVDVLHHELEAIQNLKILNAEWATRAPIYSFDTGPCLRFPKQAQFHPTKYLTALAKCIIRDGNEIVTQTHVDTITDGDIAQVNVRGGLKVLANHVVVATHTPINDRVVIHTKQAAYRSYVVGFRIPRQSIPRILLWDAPANYQVEPPDPYHYVRMQSSPDVPTHDILIVGGEDHKTGQNDDAAARFLRLETWARDRFPMIQGVDYRWSGQIMEPVDYLAFIGHNPGIHKNIFVITGDSGNGMTHGTIGGMMITDMIMGQPNPWEKVYDPSRKTLKAAKTYAIENLNVAEQYAEWMKAGEVQSIEDISAGSGAVIKSGVHRIAVYRDHQGEYHQCSAACPHLGCIVHWNSAEESWDCPCHGSRFDPFGQVTEGPAMSNLSTPPEPLPIEEQIHSSLE